MSKKKSREVKDLSDNEIDSIINTIKQYGGIQKIVGNACDETNRVLSAGVLFGEEIKRLRKLRKNG